MKRTRTRDAARAGRRGSTLVIVALLMAAVAMLSLSFVTMVRASQQEHRGSREDLSALFLCEAGLSAALQDVTSGGDGSLGNAYNHIEHGDGDFWTEGTDLGKARTSLVSYGRDEGRSMGVELVIQRSPAEYYRWAAFGEEHLHMDSFSRTDSYDSSSPYGDQVSGVGASAHANESGDVGSNGSISMDSAVGVWGDASPGMTGTLTDSNAVAGDVYGAVIPLTSNVELPELIVPSYPSLGDLSVGTSQTLPSGQYHFGNLEVGINRVLTVTGPATIVVDNFRLRSGSSFRVDATNGPVEVYVLDDFLLNSGTMIASLDLSPLDISFNLLSDNILDPGVDVTFDEDVVDFDSNSKMYGTIFAPSAEITIDSNFELYGSLVARRVDLNSNCMIHYDERLAEVASANKYLYTTLIWRIVPVP